MGKVTVENRFRVRVLKRRSCLPTRSSRITAAVRPVRYLLTLIPAEPRIYSVPLDLPRRYKVAYASSMAAELRKNVQFEAGEEILYSAGVQQRANWLWMQPGILELTSHRLILVQHHAFSADWILEIPRFAVVNITSAGDAGTDWTAISYSIGDAVETLRLRPLVLRGRPAPEQSGTLSAALRAFHAGELSHNWVVNREKQNAAAVAPSGYSSVCLLALLWVVMLIRLGIYVAKFPGEWRSMEAYAASSGCNPQFLAARAALDERDPKLAPASVAGRRGGFCAVQPMTVARVWSARGQHVRLIDSSGNDYDDVGALNSVDADLWWRMHPGERVYVLLAGDQPAWILHQGNLFETRSNPDHSFWEQSFLMLALFVFCGVIAALLAYVLRATILERRHAVLAHSG